MDLIFDAIFGDSQLDGSLSYEQSQVRKGVLPKVLIDHLHSLFAMPTTQHLMEFFIKYPQALAMADKRGRTPLFMALDDYMDVNQGPQNPTVGTMVKLCCDYAPSTLKRKYQDRLVLHVMIERDSAPSALRVLKAYPRGAKIEDYDHRLAIHMILDRPEFKDAFHELLEECLRIYPGSAQKDHHGNFPLHLALESSAPELLVMRILALHPLASASKSARGQWPLHIAIDKGFTGRLIGPLLQAHPEAVHARTLNNLLAIQVAIQMQCDREICVLLVDGGLEELVLDLKDSCLALDLALDHPDPAVTQLILNRFIESAWSLDITDRWPLETAIERGCSGEVIQALLHANPGAARTRKEATGMLPIHKALELRLHPEGVMHLLRSYPDSAGIEGTKQRLTLHYAMEFSANIMIVEELLDVNPGALHVVDGSNRTPLMMALQGGMNFEVIELLLDRDTSTASTLGPFDKLPIHFAAQTGASLDTINLLISAHQEGLSARDRDGRTPLLLACMRKGNDPTTISALIQGNPEAVEMADNYGRTPLQEAIGHRACSEVFQALLSEMDEVVLSRRDPRGKTPLMRIVEYNLPTEVIQIFIKASPETLDIMTSSEWSQYCRQYHSFAALNEIVRRAADRERMADKKHEGYSGVHAGSHAKNADPKAHWIDNRDTGHSGVHEGSHAKNADPNAHWIDNRATKETGAHIHSNHGAAETHDSHHHASIKEKHGTSGGYASQTNLRAQPATLFEKYVEKFCADGKDKTELGKYRVDRRKALAVSYSKSMKDLHL